MIFQKLKMNRQFESVLLNLENTADLFPIIDSLELGCYFIPVNEAGGRVVDLVGKELSVFNGIVDVRKRVKSLDSILFKMLYGRVENINRINDFVGFITLVESVDDCYRFFRELLEFGFKPYFRVFDTLDMEGGYYRSLDVNFLCDDRCFQVQIRTLDIQRDYEIGYLSAENYKKRKIERFRKFLKEDETFGIDFRLSLLDRVCANFERGFRNLGLIEEYSLVQLLDSYSSKDFDYGSIKELRVNDRTRRVLNGI